MYLRHASVSVYLSSRENRHRCVYRPIQFISINTAIIYEFCLTLKNQIFAVVYLKVAIGHNL